MEQARKSLQSLRQAASMRPAPSNPNSLKLSPSPSPVHGSMVVRSPSIGSPSSDLLEQESANPLFDLARAAAPSTSSLESQLRRAASPSMGSVDSELRRAASPSFGSTSSAGRIPPTTVSSNPVLKREMAEMQVNPANQTKLPSPRSPALTQQSTKEFDDPSMNKRGLASPSSSFRGSAVNLLRSPQSVVLVPARIIKEQTWGTPRRRLCTSICMLIFAIIFIYLIVRLVDTLRILNSSPAIAQFQIAEVCTSTFSMSIAGSVLNPSGSAATIRAMRSEIYIGNASEVGGTQLIAYLNTPDIYLGAGNASIGVGFNLEIPFEQAAYIRKVLKDFLNGKDLDAVAKIPLTASFGPEVFIVPISYSTTLELAFRLPKFNLTSDSNSTSTDEDSPSLIQTVELLQPNNPANYLAAKIALQLFSMKDFKDSFLEATIPPFQFDIYLGDEIALSGATSFFHYGKNPPTNLVALSDVGKIVVQGATGQPYMQGVHYGLQRFMNQSTLPIRAVIRGSNFSNPEVPTYKRSSGESCYAQSILDSFDYELELDLATLFAPSPSPSPSSTASPTATPTAEPYFQLLSYELADIDTSLRFVNKVGLNLTGLNQLYGIRGVIPTFQIIVDVDGVNSSMPNVPLISFALETSYSFYPTSPVIPAAQFYLELLSATHTIRVVNQYLINNNDVGIHIRTPSTGSVLSRLLSGITIDLSLMELLGGSSTPTSSPSSRRRLAEGRNLESAWANKAISAKILSNYVGFGANLTAQGFDSDFFGGTRILVKTLKLDVSIIDQRTYSPNRGSLITVFTLDFNSYDSSNPSKPVNLLAQMTSDGDPLLISNLIDRITVDYENVYMYGKIKYNGGTYRGNDFYFERTKDVANETNSNASPTFSFFKLYHGELLSLTQNQFAANIYFGIDLGDLQVDVSVPEIAVALSRCGEPHFIAVQLTQWAFRTGAAPAFAPLVVELEDATRVLNAVSTFAGGEKQQICIRGHPSLAVNYLSYFLGALNINIVLPGLSNDATPVGSEADLLDLEIASTQRDACVSVTLNLTDPNAPQDNSSTSFGWGAVNLLLNISDPTNAPADFLRINIDEGWYGQVDEYRATNFLAPATVKPVKANLCFLADSDLPLASAQAATKSVLQNLYDGVAIPIGVGGTLGRRIPATGPNVSVIDGHFKAPATTLKSLTTLTGTTAAANVNATQWFSLLEIELVSFNGTKFSTKITFETGSIGFNVTVPDVSFHVGKLTTPGNRNTEKQLFEISTKIPSFGFREKFPLPIGLGINLIPPQDWGDTLQLLDDLLGGSADVSVGSSVDPASNLISRMIPTITFSLSSKDVVASAATAAPTTSSDFMDVGIAAVSSQSSASVLANITLLERIGLKFIWGTLNCRLFDGVPGSSNEIGRIYVPGQILQEAGSGPQGMNMTFFGQASTFVKRVVNGSDLVLGFQGTIGSSLFTSSFKVPKLDSISGLFSGSSSSDSDSESSSTSSLKLLDAAILGASKPGESGYLPCLIDSLCSNTIRGDGDMAYSGITAGATIGFDLPTLEGIKWRISLLSPVNITIVANGFLVGRIVVWPISAQASQSLFFPVVSLLPELTQLPELRYTIKAVLDGYDTVFTLGADSSGNYLSKLASAIQQEISILDVPAPDPNAPGLLQNLKLSVKKTVRNRADLDISFNLLWNSDSLVISVGTVKADVYFGHTKTCGTNGNSYCMNGLNIAGGGTSGPLVIRPSPTLQSIKLQAAIAHSGGVLSTSQVAADDLISKYIWQSPIPLQLEVTLTPVPGNNYGATQPFYIGMFVTTPQGPATNGFIAAINVDVLGTITSSIGDVTIKATKVLKNELDFPLLISYYQYMIKLVDLDGVLAGGCFLAGGLFTSINPCSIPLLNLCYDPWATPTAIGPLITSGDSTQLKPANSILKNSQKYLMPNTTAETSLTINPTIETAARLVDEMLTKNMLCGDIVSGMFIVSLQADSNCNDANKLEADLTCTYPIRIKFDLTNFALSNLDTCGSTMDVPGYLGTTFFSDGLYQFNQVWSSANLALSEGSNSVRLVQGATQSKARSDIFQIPIRESFQIQLDVRIAGGGCGSMGEGMSMTFLSEPPDSADTPIVGLDCSTSCKDRYASKALNTVPPYASLVMAFYGCNSFAWIVNGNIAAPYRVSQSCAGDLLDNGNWGTLTFSYNAHDHRATVSYVQSGHPVRSFEFDLNLQQQLGGRQVGYLALVANTGSGGIFGACANIDYRNIVHRGPRTNGLKTTLSGSLSLVRVGEIGQVLFQARDENGRKRGRGGNTWTFEIRDAVTGQLASQDLGLTPRFQDNLDGTYILFYRLNNRGRHTVAVACEAGTAPDICNNPGQYVTITTGLFIRS